MPGESLFGQPHGTVEPADAIHVAHDFVRKCRAWAEERELPKRRAAVAATQDPQQIAKLQAWESYVAFLDHTLRELECGTLDDWFMTSGLPRGGATRRGV